MLSTIIAVANNYCSRTHHLATPLYMRYRWQTDGHNTRISTTVCTIC